MVVSHLVVLMKDQVALYSSKGLTAGYLSTEPGNVEINQEVLEGRYQLVFLNAEAIGRGAEKC